MNEIVDKFLLAGEMHLKQPVFTYSVCVLFTKKEERIQKFKKTGNTKYIHKNEQDRACFQHGMAFGDVKDLARRTAPDKFLRNKAYNIAKIQNMMGIKEYLLLWLVNSLMKSVKVGLLIMKLNKMSNYLKNHTKQLLKKI